MITWDADSFLAFLHETPLAMRTAVRLIAPIAQAAESIVRQQEKLAALGTLSAGLAHELNNPAAAARRTASELAEAMETLQDTVHQFVSSGMEREQVARLVELQQAARKAAAGTASGDAMDAADREDALAARLDELGADGWRLAEPLVRAGVDDAWLAQVAEAAGGARVAALEWVAASLTATGLVAELHESTARISELVSAIKDYTHMDRAAVAEVDLHEGLDSTLTILGHRLKQGSVTVERHYDRTLPRVTAHGSELNQVWTNLIVNSLDAHRRPGDDHHHHQAQRRGRRGRRHHRRRPRHPARAAVPCVRAVLHHQGRGRGLGPRPRHRAPDRGRPPRRHHAALAARGDHVHGHAAGGCGRVAQSRRTRL